MSNLPKTYKALQQTEKGAAFKVLDVPVKEPQQGQILIKVLACGVCHSDSIVKHEVMPVLPRIPGHEVIGEVVAVGPDCGDIKVGDRYGGGWHGYQCGTCRQCRKGDFATCQNEKINGITMDGGYGQYAMLWASAAVKIPDNVDAAEAAPLLCAGITVYNSMRHMPTKPGDLVAIQGIGGLGHLALQFAQKMGFRVAALSSSGSKEKFAKDLGANYYLDSSKKSHVDGLNELGGANLIVCTAPNSEIIAELVNGLAVDGTLLILAVPPGPLNNINAMPMIQKRLTVRAWPSGAAADSEDTLAFASSHGVKCMIEKFPLEKADEAFKAMEDGKVRFRAVLIP